MVLNYRSPLTLVNSMRTWNSSGLLTLIKEKIIILNDPLPSEIAMSLDFGFRIGFYNDSSILLYCHCFCIH